MIRELITHYNTRERFKNRVSTLMGEAADVKPTQITGCLREALVICTKV